MKLFVGGMIATMIAGGIVYVVVVAGTENAVLAGHVAGITGIIGGISIVAREHRRRQHD